MALRYKLLVGIFILAALVLGAYVLILKRSQESGSIQVLSTAASSDASGTPDTSNTVAPPLATSTPATQELGAGMRLYRSPAFHFSLPYPQDLTVEEYKETGNALTVTFEDDASGNAFEVYVTPYSGTQISAARFHTDEPSGIEQEPTDITIAGVRATMFFGNNPVMGDTREVWFIHGGYLYEVTTYKALDQWLAGIMRGWKFI